MCEPLHRRVDTRRGWEMTVNGKWLSHGQPGADPGVSNVRPSAAGMLWGGGAALRDERMWLENGSSGKWNSMKTM